MAKHYAVTPVLRPGKTVYSATFFNASGHRVTRSLQTPDIDQASLVCSCLVLLRNLKIDHPASVPPHVCLEAVQLYFDQAAPRPESSVEPVRPAAELRKISEMMQEIQDLRAEVVRLHREVQFERDRRQQIERSIIGQAAAQGDRAPGIREARQAFELHLKATAGPGHRRAVLGLVDDFLASLPAQVATSGEILPNHISAWLDARSAQGAPEKPLTRYSRYREKLGRFINWAAGQYGYRSQMGAVLSVGSKRRGRERVDIHWHELAEVQAALKALPDTYWRALVGTLAYAGLQLAELVWLRREDLSWGPGKRSAMLRITAVEEPGGAARHYLKTGHRQRTVRVHPRRLLPLLKDLVDKKLTGKVYLFAMPPGMRRRTRKVNPGHGERWIECTLSTVLRGHRGGVKRAAVVGLLPKGMNAKSLRRTFGSLLIRSGKSEAEVAAAMGNTPDVVRAHYARILGCEVDVDF